MSNKFKIIIIFVLFTFSLRIWNINKMGRTFDEAAYVIPGHTFVNLFLNGNFTDPFWYVQSDHPPLARYFYGLTSFLDQDIAYHNRFVLKHDLTFSRLTSVIVSTFSAVVVLLFAWEFVSPFVGVTSGVIFSMMPFFLGFSQIATLESFIMLFFTSSVYSFIKYLVSHSNKFLILTGVFVGLAIGVKQSNTILLPLLFLIYTIWYIKNRNNQTLFNTSLKKTLFIPFIAILTFFIIWPMPWFHPAETLQVQEKMWISDVKLPPPEVFFGKLLLVPKFYYIVLFYITTPFILLILSILGLKAINKKNNWIYYSIILWFLFPFLQSFYAFKQHGIRYIIEIYAPFCILCGLGFDYFSNFFTSNIKIKIISFIPIVIYLSIILLRISPYYLDYFNVLVGGTEGVYKNKSFQIGWWGQGTREAAFYIYNIAPRGSRIALPTGQLLNVSMPIYPGYHVEVYNSKHTYDYIMVHHFAVIRFGFNDNEIKEKYRRVYTVFADGAHLVDVYKKK